MKTIINLLIRLLFLTVLFLSTILLTLRLGLLNSHFISWSFSHHHVYESLPNQALSILENSKPTPSAKKISSYKLIASKANPDFTKSVIEDNLSQALDYFYGSKQNIVFSLPLTKLKIPEIKTDIHQPISNLPSNFTAFYNKGKLLNLLSLISFFFLLCFYPIFSSLILPTGLFLLTLGLLGKLGISTLLTLAAKDISLTTSLIEILSTSLLTDIVNIWLVLGVIISTLGLTVKHLPRK